MTQLRYGLIGAGMMGIEHLKNLALIPGAEVVAFADPHAESRRWARVVTGDGPREYERAEELLADARVDALVIATPNHTHRAVLDAAFATKLPILVEKPLCTTIADARWAVERAAAHPAPVWCAMEYRYMPPVARLLDEVRAGTIGQLRMFAIREHRFPFLPKVGDWNRFARNTGGTLVEKCCHFFDLMRLVVAASEARSGAKASGVECGSEATRVYASAAQDVNHKDERYAGETPDILDNAFVTVDFANGARAMLDLCMFAEASRNQEEICAVGERGKVECFIPESTLVIGRRSPRSVASEHIAVDARALAAGHHHGSTYFQHLRFFDAVTKGARVEVSAEDGLRAVAIGVAAERSAREKRPVETSEVM
ncbi:MAG: Gfo/Idh/MocA family oxidoreductase [Deltaproteobacteria bacterium]|nr:Gfo/Idh/MocA family oxidoreductase [Deltaproteobacteria bacterium]